MGNFDCICDVFGCEMIFDYDDMKGFVFGLMVKDDDNIVIQINILYDNCGCVKWQKSLFELVMDIFYEFDFEFGVFSCEIQMCKLFESSLDIEWIVMIIEYDELDCLVLIVDFYGDQSLIIYMFNGQVVFIIIMWGMIMIGVIINYYNFCGELIKVIYFGGIELNLVQSEMIYDSVGCCIISIDVNDQLILFKYDLFG